MDVPVIDTDPPPPPGARKSCARDNSSPAWPTSTSTPPSSRISRVILPRADAHPLLRGVPPKESRQGVPILFVPAAPERAAGDRPAVLRPDAVPGRSRRRSCGRSRPAGELRDNTIDHLVATTSSSCAGSSASRPGTSSGARRAAPSALYYAGSTPDSVRSLVLRGIWLLREAEIRWWFYEMGCRKPELWRTFAERLPEDQRGDLLEGYWKRLVGAAGGGHGRGPGVEASGGGPRPVLQPGVHRRVRRGARWHRARPRRGATCTNWTFEPDGLLLDRVDRIRHIPAFAVHGRYDIVCPVRNLDDLRRAWSSSTPRSCADAHHRRRAGRGSRELVAATRRIATTGTPVRPGSHRAARGASAAARGRGPAQGSPSRWEPGRFRPGRRSTPSAADAEDPTAVAPEQSGTDAGHGEPAGARPGGGPQRWPSASGPAARGRPARPLPSARPGATASARRRAASLRVARPTGFGRFLPRLQPGPRPAGPACSSARVNSNPAGEAPLPTGVIHARWKEIFRPSFSNSSALTRSRPARTSPQDFFEDAAFQACAPARGVKAAGGLAVSKAQRTRARPSPPRVHAVWVPAPTAPGRRRGRTRRRRRRPFRRRPAGRRSAAPGRPSGRCGRRRSAVVRIELLPPVLALPPVRREPDVFAPRHELLGSGRGEARSAVDPQLLERRLELVVGQVEPPGQGSAGCASAPRAWKTRSRTCGSG